MNIIFLVENMNEINSVYTDKVLSEASDAVKNAKKYTLNDIKSKSINTSDVQYILSTWNMPYLSEDEIDMYFPNLKAVFYAAGTTDYFEEPLIRKGIKVYSASEINGIPVAEFVVSQILLANKGYFQSQKVNKRPLFKLSFYSGKRISNKKTGNYKAKVGLIGLGVIGSNVAKLLESYDNEVFAYDPFVEDKIFDKLNCKRINIDDIFTECDVISNHLPDIESTRNMLNYSLFSRMKESATFINTGRGHQVVERDLARVMKEKPNACALLDVTRREPLLPWSKLYRCKNIFISPHIAGSISYEKERLALFTISTFDEISNNDYHRELNPYL